MSFCFKKYLIKENTNLSLLLFSLKDIKTRFCESFLNEDEKKRYSKIKINAELFLASRFFLRSVLGEKLNIEPQNVDLKIDDWGKPYIDNLNFFFNISHSKDSILIGLSPYQIGVDIEFMKEEREWKKIAVSFFSSEELTWIGDSKERFYSLWTIKEAHFKCNGKQTTDQKFTHVFFDNDIPHLPHFKIESFYSNGYAISYCLID